MKKYLPLLLLPLLAAPTAAKELKTLHEKTLYAIGLQLGADAAAYELKPNEREYVIAGLADTLKGKPSLKLADYKKKIALLAKERWHTPFANVKKLKGVQKPSGLIYKIVKPGTGPRPGSASTRVRAHYHGTFTDGKVFDSSVDRWSPFESPLNRVIKCWTEGIALMRVGEKAELTCPSDIAYGDRGRGGIPGGATLLFRVELLAIL